MALGKLSNEDAEVDSQFWCELLNLFFVNGLAGRKQPQDDDDLVYFVRLQVGSKPFYFFHERHLLIVPAEFALKVLHQGQICNIIRVAHSDIGYAYTVNHSPADNV